MGGGEHNGIHFDFNSRGGARPRVRSRERRNSLGFSFSNELTSTAPGTAAAGHRAEGARTAKR